MSRWIDIDKNEKVVEEIAEMDECKFLINEVCCNPECPLNKDFPFESDCEQCAFFTEEDGVVESDNT